MTITAMSTSQLLTRTDSTFLERTFMCMVTLTLASKPTVVLMLNLIFKMCPCGTKTTPYVSKQKMRTPKMCWLKGSRCIASTLHPNLELESQPSNHRKPHTYGKVSGVGLSVGSIGSYIVNNVTFRDAEMHHTYKV